MARRILLEAEVGDYLNVGQQFGIIRFGSRVDIWIPATTPVHVLKGQTAIAGETIIADLTGKKDEITEGFKVNDWSTTKKRSFRSVSLYWLLPNVLTIAGFVSGLTALRFAMDERWAGVIVLISVAAVFDALDGRTARRFQTSSAFGAGCWTACPI